MAKQKSAKSDKSRRFEDLMKELEAVVEKLENDEPDLEEAITAYERGMVLSRECHRRLDEAERKVRLLRQKSDGTLESSPFGVEDED